jgi:hypothetical protein
MIRRAFFMATAILAVLPGVAAAQNITLKTVPVPTGEQFQLFPAALFGMGSVSVAVDDRLAAPFANPARRLDGELLRVFATPTFYGESSNWVGGRTLPISALFAGTRVHGGFGVVVQQLSDRGRPRFWPGGVPPEGRSNVIEPSANNTYLFGSLGARLTDRTSIGLSGLHSELGAVDGVNMLYGRAWAIDQQGTLNEVRLGLAHDLGRDRALEGTITRTHLDMSHDVDYFEWRWPADVPPWSQPPTTVFWQEHNRDRTLTWGTRLRYSQPLDELSRIGLIVAGSTKAHPDIPNYNVVDIPRDPGNTAVFNIGAGVSRREAGATLAMEIILEPGRSHTWAFADTVIALPSGATLQPGDKTVDNQFRFLNWNLGIGFENERARSAYQLGLRVRHIGYTLDQENFLAERRRNTRESWMEWTPSWGALFRFSSIELQYAGRMTAKGWPSVNWFGGGLVAVDASSGVDFMVGPTGPVNIPEFRVTTHRFTLSMPLGR